MDPKSSIPSSRSEASPRRKTTRKKGKDEQQPEWLKSIPDGLLPGTRKYIQHALALNDDDWDALSILVWIFLVVVANRKMTSVRPHVLKAEFLGVKWMEVEHTVLREIAARCVNECTLQDGTFKEKLIHSVSEDPKNRIEERTWRKKLVVDFFFKRWNNFRNEKERKAESPKRKHRIGCPSCKSTNLCCNDCQFQV